MFVACAMCHVAMWLWQCGHVVVAMVMWPCGCGMWPCGCGHVPPRRAPAPCGHVVVAMRPCGCGSGQGRGRGCVVVTMIMRCVLPEVDILVSIDNRFAKVAGLIVLNEACLQDITAFEGNVVVAMRPCGARNSICRAGLRTRSSRSRLLPSRGHATVIH